MGDAAGLRRMVSPAAGTSRPQACIHDLLAPRLHMTLTALRALSWVMVLGTVSSALLLSAASAQPPAESDLPHRLAAVAACAATGDAGATLRAAFCPDRAAACARCAEAG